MTRLHRASSIDDRHERAAAVERLRAQMNLAAIVDAARTLTEGEDFEVRRTAAEVLGSDIGDGLSAERLGDVAAIGDGDCERLEAVALELGRSRSVDAIPVLGLLVAHEEASVRAGAAGGLGELLRVDERAAAPLRYLAGDEDADVSRVARRALNSLTTA